MLQRQPAAALGGVSPRQANLRFFEGFIRVHGLSIRQDGFGHAVLGGQPVALGGKTLRGALQTRAGDVDSLGQRRAAARKSQQEQSGEKRKKKSVGLADEVLSRIG